MSVNHHVKIFTTNGPFMPMLDLKTLEAGLPADYFKRINRATIVALDRVKWFDSCELGIADTTFSFGDKYYKEFREKVPVILQDTKPKVLHDAIV